MPDPDRDAEPERRTDPRFDDWPVERYEAYAEWPVERATPADDDRPAGADDPELIGFVGRSAPVGVGPAVEGDASAGRPYLYDHHTADVVAGELDEENERIVVREAGERHDATGAGGLGERIEAFGDEHGWAWLSSFAREHLEDDGDARPAGLELEASEFGRRNLADSAARDLAFVGSHTVSDATGQVYVLERDFDVFRGDAGATVSVDEVLLAAAEPREEDRAGDADVLEERTYELEVDVDPDDPNWAADVEGELREYHDEHAGLLVGE